MGVELSFSLRWLAVGRRAGAVAGEPFEEGPGLGQVGAELDGFGCECLGLVEFLLAGEDHRGVAPALLGGKHEVHGLDSFVYSA